MASYAAMCSLKQTIQRLLNSSTISILSPSREIVKFAYEEVESLQEYLDILKGSSGERVDAMNAQIREAASNFEDAVLRRVSDQFLSQTEDQINIGADQILSIDLEEVKHELCSFTETLNRILEEYIIEDPLADEFLSQTEDQINIGADQILSLNLEEVKQGFRSFTDMLNRILEKYTIKDLLAKEDDDISSRIDFGEKCSKMVGFSDLFSKIRNVLTDRWPEFLYLVSLVGMAGIGKSTLAMKIFEDLEILSHFDHKVFVTVGQKYEFWEVMIGILAQLTPNIDEIHKEGVDKVHEYLFKTLSNKRYLIVLDDVWDKSIFELVSYLPDDSNRSRILVTTRLDEVAYRSIRVEAHRMPFLNKEESWDLLHEKVFSEEYLCPFQLEKYGKKIAENCEGLPLAIVTVAGILSKNEKTLEYWKQTAKKKNSVFTDAYDQMLPRLYLSYKYLSPYFKPCFLYMGVFPPSWKITTSKLVKLLSAEGFLGPHPPEKSELVARECLDRVVSNSLALNHQQSSTFETKTWSLHSAYWHLCNKLAGVEKFFHVINSYPHSISAEGIKSPQRLCIHNNVLFGIKEVYNSMESSSTVRSLLCTGPHHQYPVPICFGLRFLRVLDALTVRFYKFPIEVLKLVQLRYLALTCNGNVPASISNLWSLEYFFVRRHLSIKPSGDWPCLPVEIWNMKELRHLQVMGSNLPYCCGAMLPNLLTLTDMSADSCTAEILRGTPNLKKLGIQIELPPDGAKPLCFFDHLSHLHRLESLKCIIVNPKPRSHVVAPLTAFPSGLKKLSLSGSGYPWEYMNMIAQMPSLEVLKLRRFAFQGPEWKTEGDFMELKFLLIEETDLVHWVADRFCFPWLKRLTVRHCYKLKGIPSDIGKIPDLEMIELVDCPSAVNSVKQIQKENEFIQVRIQCSWHDGELKS